MSATFRQPEISVREELNALQGLKDRSVDPGYGTDIGGGTVNILSIQKVYWFVLIQILL